MVRDYTRERNSYKGYAASLKPTLSDDEIEYKRICEEVGSDLVKLLEKYNRLEITKQLAEVEGVSVHLARVTIGDYTKGEFWHSISPTRQARVDKNLRRLSHFYGIIGFTFSL